MDLQGLQELSEKELEQFKRVCNELLGHTFVVKHIYKNDEEWVTNPDYLFLLRYFDLVKQYLWLLDWQLMHDDSNGFFYVMNTDNINCCRLDKLSTAILLVLRLYYELYQEQQGMYHDVLCTVHDLLEKIINEYAIITGKPNMEDIRKALTLFEGFHLVQRVEGRFNQQGCRFTIMPTILVVVTAERLNAVVEELKKETQDEKAEKNLVD